jgi:hypothetical protein
MKFVSREAVPPGGSFADGVEFFTNAEHRKRVLEKAESDALAAIQLIKSAPDNPYGNDDEEIAGVLLNKIRERLNQK